MSDKTFDRGATSSAVRATYGPRATWTLDYVGAAKPSAREALIYDPKLEVYVRFPLPDAIPDTLTVEGFHRINLERCRAGFEMLADEWSPADWMTATVGEVGELANLLKKRRRGEKVDPADVAAEWADAYTYLMLLADSLGISPARALFDKFNAVSDRINSPIKLGIPIVEAQDIPSPAPPVYLLAGLGRLGTRFAGRTVYATTQGPLDSLTADPREATRFGTPALAEAFKSRNPDTYGNLAVVVSAGPLTLGPSRPHASRVEAPAWLIAGPRPADGQHCYVAGIDADTPGWRLSHKPEDALLFPTYDQADAFRLREGKGRLGEFIVAPRV